MLMGTHSYETIVIRPEPFWDTHRVENCGRGYKKGEVCILLQFFEFDFYTMVFTALTI